MNKRIVGAALCICLLLSLFCIFSNAASASDTALSVAKEIIAWKKADNGAAPEDDLINEKYLALAGTTPGDWYPIALGRLGITDNNAGYLSVIKDQIEKRYRSPGKLSAAKATEWHRIALAVLSMGGDPTQFGSDENGNPINLIADGTYNRGRTASLGRQGINGWIWGLIALDSLRYEVPVDAYYTRDDIIIEILRQQLSSGGFALSGKTADPDITAMAIQALAPYYNSEKTYTYTQKESGRELSQNVHTVIEEALSCLSLLQLDTGDFESWGTQNVESTDQVLVALCCLGIDPLTDNRFIKNGNTLLDGILRYHMPDGGFIHSFTYDSDNPTSLPDQSNTMAGEQTLYAMAALWRQQNGMRTLYDFRPEQSAAVCSRIAALSDRLSSVTAATDKAELAELLTAFYSVSENERSYVQNYWTLSDAAKKAGIDINKIADTAVVIEDTERDPNETVILYFTESDRQAADSLPDELTTEQYVLITTLLDKLNRSEDFDGKEFYLQKLQQAKAEVASVQVEIDRINADIKDKLYPFENVSVKDKKTIDDIVARYESLGVYDQAKIERFEDVVKARTKVDNLLRAYIITACLSVLASGVAVCLVLRVKKRRKRKEAEMEALAQQYIGEDKDESD